LYKKTCFIIVQMLSAFERLIIKDVNMPNKKRENAFLLKNRPKKLI